MEDTKHLHIEFYTKTVENKKLSKQKGRPIHEDKEYIRIRFVGDIKKEHHAPADDKPHRGPDGQGITYKELFPRHYEAYLENKAVVGEGTPIEELTFITAAKRADLKALNIHTAEGLAGLDGAILERLGMGGRQLKTQAEAWLAKAADTAVETKLAAENEALKDEMERLKGQVAQLMNNAQPAPEQAPFQTNSDSPFADWQPDDIKAFIKDRSGEGVRGTPSKETLIAKADAILEAEAKEAA